MRGLVQLALDFFGALTSAEDAGAMPPPPRRRTPAGLPRPRISKAKVPDTEEGRGPSALLSGAGDSLPQHPLANREAMLEGRRVAYEFRRGKRRTIGFSVGPEGLVIRAPSWVPMYEIDAALVEKAEWILRKLTEAGARRQQHQQIDWAEGAQFPLLGETATVTLGRPAGAPAGGVAKAQLLREAGSGPVLRLPLPADATPEAIAGAVRAWLQAEARRLFVLRLDHFAPRMGVRWARFALTSARARWGSASSTGSIRLHWRLMHFRPEVVDYVVVHELAHLRHMDHSPRFWAVVASEVPDHMTLRRELRTEGAPRWD